MPDPCSTHPDRPATGTCSRCGGRTCAVCTVDVAGRLYCSILCFTEHALALKGRPVPKRHDPLAEAMISESPAQDEPSVVLSAADSNSETSILNISSLKRASESEESTIVPVEGRMKEPTSILNMAGIAKAPDGSWLEEPPQSETPLPILLPGTRRSTIQSTCVFHGDTPAVVRCSRCRDPICTLCIADEDHGGRCSPNCRRDRRRSGGRAIAVLAGTAALAMLAWMFRPAREVPTPPPARPPVESVAKAEADARAAEEERRRLEAEAREEARRRVEAREKEEARLKAEAEARAKAEADAREAALKAEAEAKAAAAAAFAKAEADAREALAKAEARAAAEAAATAARDKAAAEARAKAEAAAKAKAEAEALEKAKADAAAARALALETALRKASGLIREATPAFGALADQADADPDDARALVPRIDSVIGVLTAARAEYAAILDQVATRSTLERRIAILEELVAALRAFRVRCVEAR